MSFLKFSGMNYLCLVLNIDFFSQLLLCLTLIFLSIEIKQTFNIGYISLCKESLNSDEHQFHQYQQNEQSPLISIYLTQEKDHNIYWYQLTSLPLKTKKKKTTTYTGIN